MKYSERTRSVVVVGAESAIAFLFLNFQQIPLPGRIKKRIVFQTMVGDQHKKSKFQNSLGEGLATAPTLWGCHSVTTLQIINNKHTGKLMRSDLFHQDKAPTNKTLVPGFAMEDCDFDLVLPPPFSPDLALSDYHLFHSLKKKATFLEVIIAVMVISYLLLITYLTNRMESFLWTVKFLFSWKETLQLLIRRVEIDSWKFTPVKRHYFIASLRIFCPPTDAIWRN